MISVRLVTADSYQAQPLPQLDPTFSEFRGSEIKHVPIIRIFGSTSTGEKTCLHIHGIFPYLYVPYTGEEDPRSLAYRLAASLDTAINVSLGSATSNTQHVYLIQRVSGIPFYGYHRKEHQYLKIYFYNPAMIKRAADLLQNGSVLNQSLQPHEAHIPYILQFMIDYNVYGMSFVNLSRVRHRRLTQTLAELTSSGQSVNSENSEIEYLPADIERQSTCEIEMDAMASDITNRREIESGLELNPGLAAIWEEERARRAQAGFQGGDSQLVNPKSPQRPTFRPTDNDIYQDQRLARRLLMISQSDESTLSTTAHQSVAYAAEIREGESLLNSSYLPFSRPTAERSQPVGHENSMLHTTFIDSPTESVTHRLTPESSILGADDMSLVNLLDQLAEESVENQESVDLDSLLGSQVSAFLNDEKSDNENGDEDDDDAVDLNLTSLQLDSLSSLEIATEKVKEALRREKNPLSIVDESPVISPYEISSSSRSAEEEKAKKACRVPQYDGAGDVSPTLLDSDEEDNATNTKEFSHLPEYNGSSDLASKSRKFDDLEQSLKTPLSNAFVASKDSGRSGERFPNSSLVDTDIDDASVLPVLGSDVYLPPYNEPLDRFLEIGPEFVPDLEGLHSSMEIGILLSSGDPDSPESVNEALESDNTIPLETVLNGDPCFTESAELDKSDLTELQDQYDSLRGNYLLPNVHTNLRIDNDLGNSSNFSDSDYQTSEKPCEILLNVRSPRSPMTSRESSSSSENVAPNIQEPEAKGASRDKFNAIYASENNTLDRKYPARIANDNSDYNCNVVATWAELQNLQFVEKDKKDGRSGRSRERGQHSQGSRQIRRRASRRSDERAASQILRLDSEKTADNTISLAPLQVNYNCPSSPQKLVVSESPMKILTDLSPPPIVAEVTLVETTPTNSSVDFVKEKSPEQLAVAPIAAEVEIEVHPVFEQPEAQSRLDVDFHRSTICTENRFANIENTCPTTCVIDETESVVATVDSEESPMNPLTKSNELIRTKEFPGGSSYYSSERSERDYTIDGFEHLHCLLLKNNSIIQDEGFTSDQVWVIQKRKRGRKLKSQKKGICISGDCAIPIVRLVKIDAKSDVSVANVVNSENIQDSSDSPIDENSLKTPEDQPAAPVIDAPVEKSNLSEYREVASKTQVQKKRIDSSSSESSADNISSSSGVEKDEKNDSINEVIDEVIRRSGEEVNYPETNDCEESMDRTFMEEHFSPGDTAYNRRRTRKGYSDKTRSIRGNTKKIISTRALSSKNGLCRGMSRTGKREVSLPGIPGSAKCHLTKKRDLSGQDVLTCHNVVDSDNKLTETPRKTKNTLQSVVFSNWDSKREISTPRLNGLLNGVQKCYVNRRKNASMPDRDAVDAPEFSSPHVSPIPKRYQSPRRIPKDLTHALNRSSTPKKISSEISATGEDKIPECVALNLMINETNSRRTRAKLKMLLETRKKCEVSSFTVKVREVTTGRKSVSNEEPVGDIKTSTPIFEENPEVLTIPDTAVDTRQSIEEEEIRDKKEIDETADDLNASFETITDNSELSEKNCQPVANSFGVVGNADIFTGTTLDGDLCSSGNDVASEIFEADLAILGNTIDDVNSPEEVSNERKELSYRSDQFTSTIADHDFFYGNNYTIDAVSLEMPACLFEEDSNSVDKRSPKKVIDSCLPNFNDSQNSHDAYSDVSIDPRDLDVYDVESLTPSSSLGTLDETTTDTAISTLSNSETMSTSLVESFNTSETQTASTEQEESQGDFKREDIDSSFEEASPAFEALSPRPKFFNLSKILAEEFIPHSKTEIAGYNEKLNTSSTSTSEAFTREARGGKWAVEDAELDHEIQDLVSQVVVQFENESEFPCVIEVIEWTPSNIRDRSASVAAGSEIQTHDVETPVTRPEREKGLPNAAEENQELFSKRKWMSTSETNEKLQATDEKQMTKETDSRNVEVSDIEDRAHLRVSKSRKESQPTVTRESKPIVRRVASNEGGKVLKRYFGKKPRVNNVNYASAKAKHCKSPHKQPTKTSKLELPKKSTKLRIGSDNLVNIDLSRYKGFVPKKCKWPSTHESKSVVKAGGKTGPKKLTRKSALKSIPRNIFKEVSETAVPAEFQLNQGTRIKDKKIESLMEQVVSGLPTLTETPETIEKIEEAIMIKSLTEISGESEECAKPFSPETAKVGGIYENSEKIATSTPMQRKTSTETPYVNDKIEKSIAVECTKLDVISEATNKFENSIPMELTEPVTILDEDEKFENSTVIEKFEKTEKFENSKIIGKSTENDKIEKLQSVEKSEEGQSFDNPKSIEKSRRSENSEETTPVEWTAPIRFSEKCESFEKIINMVTKEPSQNSPEKTVEKIINTCNPPERRSPRKCAEKTRQKLSHHVSSHPSDTEAQLLSEKNGKIDGENFSQGSESLVREETNDPSLQNGFITNFTKVCSADDLVRENSMEKNITESALESVVLMQNVADENTAPSIRPRKECCSVTNSPKNSRDASPEISVPTEDNSSGDELTSLTIMDENMKPKTPFLPNLVIRGKSGRFVRPKIKLRGNPLFRSTAPSRAKISFDSIPLAQRISVNKIDQESTCYHQPTPQNNSETNTEAVNSDSKQQPIIEKLTPESKLLEAQENSSKSDSVSQLIHTNLEFSSTPTRRNHATNTAETITVPKSSTEPAPLEESVCDIAKVACQGINIVSEKIGKNNADENIFVKADNSCGQQIFLESLSSSKENLADIITEKIESSSPKIAEEKKPRSLSRRRRSPGKSPRSRRRKRSPKKSVHHTAKINFEVFDQSSKKSTPVLTAESSIIVEEKRLPHIFSESNDEETSLKASPLQVKSVGNPVENIFEKSSKLSLKIKNEELESTPADNADNFHLNISTLLPADRDSTKEISRLPELTDIAGDLASCIKTKRRGRSQKILNPNVEKLPVEHKPSIAENAQATDNNKALDSGKRGKASTIGNNKSNIFDKVAELNSQTSSSSTVLSTDEAAWNSADEDFQENDSSIPNNADENVNSMISDAVSQRRRRRKRLQNSAHVDSESSEVTRITSRRRNCTEKTAESNSSIPKLQLTETVSEESARENRLLAREETKTLAITPKRLGRPRKKLVLDSPNTSSKNNNLNTVGTDSQGSGILSHKSDEEDIVHRPSAPKKVGRPPKRRKNPAIKIVEVVETSPQGILEEPVKAEPTDVKPKSRPLRKPSCETFSTEKGDQNTKENTPEVSETSSQGVAEKSLAAETNNIKTRRRSTQKTTNEKSSVRESDKDIEENSLEASEASLLKTSDQTVEAESTNIKKNGRSARKITNVKSSVQESDKDVEEKTLEASEASLLNIPDQTVEDDSTKVKKNGRSARKTTNEESSVQESDKDVEEKTLEAPEASPLKLLDQTVEAESTNVKKNGRSARKTTKEESCVQESDKDVEEKTLEPPKALPQKISDQTVEVDSTKVKKNGRSARKTTNEESSVQESDKAIEEKTLESPKASLQKISDQTVEADSTNVKKNCRSARKTSNEESSVQKSDKAIEEKTLESPKASPQKISDQTVEADSTKVKRNGRSARKTSNEESSVQKSDKAIEEKTLESPKASPQKISDQIVEADSTKVKRNGRSARKTTNEESSVQESDKDVEEKTLESPKASPQKISDQTVEAESTNIKKNCRSARKTSNEESSVHESDKDVDERTLESPQKISKEKVEADSTKVKKNDRSARKTTNEESSVEESDKDIEEKTRQASQVSPQKISDRTAEVDSTKSKKKGRSARKTSSQELTAEENYQEGSEKILEKLIADQLINVPDKNSRPAVENSSKDSPSTEEICEEITEKTSRAIELSCRTIVEAIIEPKSSTTSRRSSRSLKNQEDAPEAPLTKSKKKTQSEESSEDKSENSNASEGAVVKISDETLAESNLLSAKIAEELLEMQTTVRSRKRVRFDENSIRNCTHQLKSSEPPPDEKMEEPSPCKHRKHSPNPESSPKTANTRNKEQTGKVCKNPKANEDLSTTGDVQADEKEEIPEPAANNGATEKRESSPSSSDDSLDSWPLHDRIVAGLVGPTTEDQTFTKLTPSSEPKIILKRLSRRTLTAYGYKYNSKKKIFVKYYPDPDYEVPAYDGAADFSSSESDDDHDRADVTIAKEEKRVCIYQSTRKPAANARKDVIYTPKKRKFDDMEEAQSPTRKHRTRTTPGNSSKRTPYRSPNRTSMLKSPGRVSGFYRPLQIIVTSPKVRKETSEPRATDVRLENRDVPNSTGACLTPRRQDPQRLHENLLRGRISAMKSPSNDIGDKRAPIATTGSQRPGELDEINESEQSERNALDNTRECREAIGNQKLTTMLRDGKDVRKKLVFSVAKDQLRRTETPTAKVESTNLTTSCEPGKQFPTSNNAKESLEIRENFALVETTTLDPQPGPSSLHQLPDDENLDLYEVTTDEESENDDGACNVTFTQYIDSQIGKNQVFTLDRKKIGAVSNGVVSLRPKFNPPSRQRIIDTMETYSIPKYRNQEPFFSDETDVPKQKELAQKMLKVPGKGLKDLPAFVSALEGVTGLARWRRMKINEFQPALAKAKGVSAIRPLVGDAKVSLTPLIKPPTQKAVRNWLRAREYLQKKKTRQEEMTKETEVAREIVIQDSIVETEENECESSDLDVTVIEASPEKIVGSNDSGKTLNRTLRMKLATKGLAKKAEELQMSELTISESVGAKDSAKTSGSREVQLTNSNSNEVDPSLLSVLQNSRLFKDQEASRHLGVSFGQIEFLSDSTRSNVSKENLQNVKALTRYQYLTIMCLEVHVTTRGDLLPDAQHDSIAAIFYSVQSDVPPSSTIKPLEHGVIVLAEEDKAKNKMHYSYASNIPWSIYFANNEEALLNALVTLVTRTDPEILIGWELETLSWGYVFQRASRLGMDLSKQISRIPTSHRKWDAAPAPDTESMADVKLPGRIVLDIWRIMRSEAALLSYTFESLMHHVLNERVPCPSHKILTDWWNLERCRASRWRVVEHYSIRVLGVLRILDHLDIIGRTSELARLFGIQFYEVFSRGSQFRVESVMLRLAKPLNYIPVSPSPMQRASMRAMEALPLILEPESMFYSDPLIVLDFQSLYPSIIIAHNYCFSTCLGRVEHIGQPQPFEFGAYTLRVSKNTALKLRGKVNFAPCGVAFVKSEVRLGILPRMLTEILDTRFMVKKAMKDHKQADKTLQRALHSRQHGLKFLANVTYGYTAANFSGRMPCIEVGDSVISKSKETLERAIKLVETTPKWGARVVYGDTDSLFILVPGKSKADAFIIGNEIADAVTASNLPPIKLKFEKVMYPSILQTKKRYCGYMYETPDQETPTYLAKGIETVRRDGCPAVSKVLEKTLKILFETKDVSLVKKYVTRQLDKVLRGKVSIQDLTFAKEFRGLKGYSAKACVPALELTRRLMRKDPRAIPRNSERVRYVIVAGAPNQALIHCVRTPWELINDPGLRPNAIYYVTRVIIPPLNRCLNLMGVDVNAWYREMPHRQILDNPVGQPVDKQKLTIFQYFGTIVCVSCGQPSSKGICMDCLAHPADTLVVLHDRLRSLHRTFDQVTTICQSCVGQTDGADCSSLDCPVLYRRAQAQRELSQATHLRSIIECGNNLEF